MTTEEARSRQHAVAARKEPDAVLDRRTEVERISASRVADRQGEDRPFGHPRLHSSWVAPKKAALKALCVALALTCGAGPARAQTAEEIEADDFELPEVSPWSIGIAFERTGATLFGGDVFEDQLIGLSLIRRGRHLGLETRLMLSPSTRVENMRGLLAGGARAYLELFGTELSYGVGATIAARLRDHFWLVHLAPVEVGVALYREGSARIDLFVGARYLVAGDLINTFLLDPNGFNNEIAEEDLATKKERGWEAFITIVFAHVLD
jgi:hypothetical protein